MRVISWNVNGLRSVISKGDLGKIRSDPADVLCLQEVKMNPDVVPVKGYPEFHQFYALAMKKGYSGVGTWCRSEPTEVEYGLGIDRFDSEGRTLITHFDDLVIINCYFPNGKQGPERLRYKLDFYDAFLDRIEEYRRSKGVVFCGDVNTAHNEIDLAHPLENSDVSGFLRTERDWIDRIVGMGWIDTFRAVHGEEVAYTWWDYKTRARERDIGWRIDYFFINREIRSRLKDAFILSGTMGSDHCPIGIEIAR